MRLGDGQAPNCQGASVVRPLGTRMRVTLGSQGKVRAGHVASVSAHGSRVLAALHEGGNEVVLPVLDRATTDASRRITQEVGSQHMWLFTA